MENPMTAPEKMEDFFAARVEGYDEHMLGEVVGCKEGYPEMARLIPEDTRTLLDLGCGTGLELDEIFRRFPDLAVTGVDLCEAMLNRLRAKHPGRDLRLICGDYFIADWGKLPFDCAVSFETMHHFSHEKKIRLYQRIFAALRDGGRYIECDYMVDSQAEEDCLFFEFARLKKEFNLPEGDFYHFDTPCTVENQIALLRSAGFSEVKCLFRMGNTTILTAEKSGEQS